MLCSSSCMEKDYKIPSFLFAAITIELALSKTHFDHLIL